MGGVIKREKPVCDTCGSDDIVKDATARWDTENQEWELSGTFDSCLCGNCEREMKHGPEWVEI